MKSRITLLTIACAAVIFVATAAQGATRYFREITDNNWSTTTNWDDSSCSGGGSTGIPQTNDDVVICPSKTCDFDVASESIASLELQSSATFNTSTNDLTISSASGLSLSGTSAQLNIDDQGLLELTGGGALTMASDTQIKLRQDESVLRVRNDVTLAANGTIVGENDAARIEIGYKSGTTPAVFTNSGTIQGKLVIDDYSAEAGSFANQGIVDANAASGTVKVAIAGTLSDGTNADRWKVSENGAQLKFDASIGTVSALSANFVMTSGDSSSKLIFDKSVTTSGRLQMSTGEVQVNQNVTMGDDSAFFANVTGGQVVVAAGAQFIHN